MVEGHLNPGLFKDELLNPGLFKHEFLNHGVKKFTVEKSGDERSWLNLGVEKSGVEMSFNHIFILYHSNQSV